MTGEILQQQQRMLYATMIWNTPETNKDLATY
jgi:hypothetical protein